MNVRDKIFFIVIFIALSFFTQAQQRVNILLLNSYHHGYSWTDELTEGIRSTLDERSNTTLFIEYLDAKRNPGYYNSRIFEDAFFQKYKTKQIDIVISSDNAALDFLLKHSNVQFLKNASYIATGISNYQHYTSIPNLYIVPETSTFEQTLFHIFSFFPKTQKIVFVTDTLQTGQIYIEEVKNILNRNYPDVDLKVLNNFTTNTLPQIIKEYKYPDIIYSGTVTIDKNGEPVNEFEIANIIQENAEAPVFSGFYGTRITKGYIGGTFTSGYENGQTGGKVALKIIDKIPNIPQVTYPPIKTVFNHEELLKYKISENLVPNDAIVLNKPESFFKKNKHILTISGVIILNLLFIIALFVYLWLSQKKHKHKLLEAVEQAQQANKLKTTFLENVSHEMRTPLNSIIGFSDVLSEMITEKTEKEYLKIISDNALDLNNLISNIFNFSLLKSHQVALNYSNIKPSQLVETILNESFIKQKFENKNISLQLDFDQIDISVVSDAEKLYQVLKSTLHNALKYTQKGTITIKYRFSNNKSLDFNDIKNTAGEKIAYLLFTIKDTGIGITPEELEFIFEPFRQADERNTNANRGLGLGLSISKSIIEIMGGRLLVKSQPGKGTQLSFSIPVKPESTNK